MHSSTATLGTLRTAVAARHQESALVRRLLIGAALVVVGVLIVAPVVLVFYMALGRGLGVYWDSIVNDPDTLHAIKLTLIAAPAAVVLNTLFGLSAAWAIARFRFRGRNLLTTMLDVPFSVSPVVAGLMLVLLFGRTGFFGPFLRDLDVRIIWALPGIIMATAFVTMPFIARELLPVMEATGKDEEMAAISLGANGWQMFWRVTLPNIKWGLLYGMILCNARAMGEFGAVYVVSGRISGQTETMPLRIEKLFQDPKLYETAFALASLLTLLALITLGLKVWLERKTRAQLAAANDWAAGEITTRGLNRPLPADPRKGGGI